MPRRRAKSSARDARPPAAELGPALADAPEEPGDEAEPSAEEPSAEELAAAAAVLEAELVELADDDADEGLPAELDGADDGAIEVQATSGIAALVPSGARSLVVQDPLQAYMNEVKRHPLLTREEEHELALRYHEHGDLAAARTLVAANLRLVVKIAHQYRKAYRNILDLIQEGNIGLMHAVSKFDPYRGVKLSSYAAWWIRAYILKFVLANWRLVKIGTTQAQRKLFFNLRREVEQLKEQGIDDPGPKLLAERMDVPVHEVQTMQKRLASRDVSLDAPLRSGDEGDTTRLEMVSDRGAAPDDVVANRQISEILRDKVRAFGATLSGREREIFELRTVAEEPLTLQEIGDRYGITRERARQLEQRMIARLREQLRAEVGDVEVFFGGGDD